jgi:acyl-CoA synthetase (AMP-forming)/AMP-acid ligase II
MELRVESIAASYHGGLQLGWTFRWAVAIPKYLEVLRSVLERQASAWVYPSLAEAPTGTVSLEEDVSFMGTPLEPHARGHLTLWSSGTTGSPKAIEAPLCQTYGKKKQGNPDERWLLTYHPGRWAGVSVLLHTLKARCLLLAPEGADQVLSTLLRERPTHVSCSPTLLKIWLGQSSPSDLAQVPLVQITFGGESATQATLDLAQRIWPRARITHTYASTEFGDICSVSDGLEGIPRSKFAAHVLSDPGELLIQGRPTGDLWELRGDRYFFLGRTTEIINVAGNKVSPIEVEKVLLAQNSELEMVRVYGVANPLTGQVVAAEYTGAIEPSALRFRDVLPKHAWPRRITRVDRIAFSPAHKIVRSGTS